MAETIVIESACFIVIRILQSKNWVPSNLREPFMSFQKLFVGYMSYIIKLNENV